jgi:hypothetical protein
MIIVKNAIPEIGDIMCKPTPYFLLKMYQEPPFLPADFIPDP